jgi:hypothetical protein
MINIGIWYSIYNILNDFFFLIICNHKLNQKAMIDVDEVYKVPTKKSKSSMNVINKLEVSNNDNEIKNDSKIKIDQNKIVETLSSLNLYSTNDFETYHRHCNQILIRGDNVVTVVLAD